MCGAGFTLGGGPVVPQPLYGPDLYPVEIFTFLKQQVKLQGRQSKSERKTQEKSLRR
jgi:hypothetical protein